jgi:hypothetical protein
MGTDSESGCSAVGACILMLALGFYCGYVVGDHARCQAAIKAGVALYEVDPMTGETRFVYVKAAATR